MTFQSTYLGRSRREVFAVGLLILLGLLSRYRVAQVAADSVEVAQEPIRTLSNIVSLDDNCVGRICRNFQFTNTSTVAFFDLITQVYINGDATYEINSRKMDSLVFENSTFVHFPLHLFYSINMRELDMRNCSIQILTWECFLMAEKLQILLLSDNKIRAIDEMTFNYASSLQYLFLNSNRLRHLVSESFKGLGNLRYLDLSDNRIQTLPAQLFDYLPSLQELHLGENRLRVIDNGMFAKTPQIVTLTLNNNKLHELGEYAVQVQTNLRVLDLSNNAPLRTLVMTLQVRHLLAANCSLNRINIYGTAENVNLSDNEISELYFSQPEGLQTLNLRNNSLQQIASLTRATNLHELILADNPQLGDLPASWPVNSLKRLDLSNTGISQLPISSLAEQNNLRYVNVAKNKIRSINPLNFKYLEKLTHFDINSNEWNCFNLRLMMQLLFQPHQISYKRDQYDPNFPGEYINGIACMYRIEEPEQELDAEVRDQMTTGETMAEMRSAVLPEDLSNQSSDNTEIEKLRHELKAVVGFYEQKFDKAFEMINDLKARLMAFERLNETFWRGVTITV